LSDLRVIEDGASEVPYQLVTESVTEGKTFANATIVDRATRDGDSVVVVDVGAGGLRHNALELQISSDNFRRQVSLYSSDILLKWNDPKWGWINPSTESGTQVESTDAFIYHFSDPELNFKAGNSLVYYPETGARYVRIVLHKENEKKIPLDISRVSVFREARPTEVDDDLTIPATITQNSKEQSTEIVADLGGRGLPIKSIALSTLGDANFNRRAVVLGSNDMKDWSAVGQGYLFSVATPLFHGKELSVRFPEVSYRYVRVVIFNNDDKPVPFANSLIIKSALRSIVFPIARDHAYALYYGNTMARTPTYDLARYFPYVESMTIPRASLAQQVPNDLYAQQLPPKKPFADEYPQLVNGTLVVLVIIIGVFLTLYIKKIAVPPPEKLP
jgi:hypothetical protein